MVKRRAVKQSKASHNPLPGKQIVRETDKACPHPFLFNLGHLCDELGTLLQPMSQRDFGSRLLWKIENIKKTLTEVEELAAQKYLSLKLSGPEMEIMEILGRYFSPTDRGMIEETSMILRRAWNTIQGEMAKRRTLLHYAISFQHPPLNADLWDKIKDDFKLAYGGLVADRRLIATAIRLLKPFSALLRRKRNPAIMEAGLHLVRFFQKQGYSKGESIRGAYTYLSDHSPNCKPSSLHSFHVSINRILH